MLVCQVRPTFSKKHLWPYAWPATNRSPLRTFLQYYNRGFDLQMDGHRHLEFETITDAEFLEYYFQLLIRPGSEYASRGPVQGVRR